MARKTILVCDKCGKEVDEDKGAVLRVTYSDARRTSKQADLCETCAGTMPGRAVARRGRRGRLASAVSEHSARSGPEPRFRRRQSRSTGRAGAAPVDCGARQRGQGRASPRPLPRGPRGRQEPVLVVPNRADVDRVESELLARAGALLGGSIVVFDGLFDRIAAGGVAGRPLGRAERSLLVRRVLASADLGGFSESAARGGFAESLLQAFDELEAGLLEPEEVGGELGAALGGLPRRAAERSAARTAACAVAPPSSGSAPTSTHGRRAGIRVRIRGSDRRGVGAARGARRAHRRHRLAPVRARARRVPLAPANGRGSRATRGRCHRGTATAVRRYRSSGARAPRARALRGRAGRGGRHSRARSASSRARAAAARSSSSARSFSRSSAPARRRSRSASSCPASSASAASLDTVLGQFGIPYSVDGEVRITQTPLGHALAALLRFAWADGTRNDLFTYLRSPFSGLERAPSTSSRGACAGGRSRTRAGGRGVGAAPRRAAARARRAARAEEPVAAVREQVTRMLRNAHGVEHPPADDASRLDLRAFDALSGSSPSSTAGAALGGDAEPRGRPRRDRAAHPSPAARRRGRARRRRRSPPRAHAALRSDVRTRAGGGEPAAARRRLAVPRRRRAARARRARRAARAARRGRRATATSSTRRARARRGGSTSCARRPTTTAARARRARSGTTSSRCSIPRTCAARRRAGRSRRSRRRSTRRRPTASACAASPSSRRGTRGAPTALARANGWDRRLERARAAFRRPTRITSPLVLEQLGSRSTFGVTELERFADCSSAWFVERFLAPKTIDAEPDAMQRGSVAHTALHRFFARIPAELGVEKLGPDNVDGAKRLMRQCLDEAVAGVRMDLTEMQAARARPDAVARPRGVRRGRVRVGAGARAAAVRGRVRERPRRAGAAARPRARAGLTLSGKIDRIDVEPFGARGIVQDYKSGRHAHSAREIERELRLQVPLYMLVLRDLVGLEPLGGLYRPLAGARRARGLVRASEAETLPGYVEERLPRGGRLLGRRRVGARDRGDASRGGSARATCAMTRATASARRGATSGRCAGWSGHEAR